MRLEQKTCCLALLFALGACASTEQSRTAAASVGYTHAGYYDRDGNYLQAGTVPDVPRQLFPPPGQCRIWYDTRVATSQPNSDACDKIRNNVPEDAFVIYGG